MSRASLPTDWSSQEISLWESLARQIQSWKDAGKTVVLATGVFDIFHGEHKKFLEKAKLAGDILVVGIESDQRVRELKGEGRPIYSAEHRIRQVQEFPAVDSVGVLPEKFSSPEHHRAIISLLRPDILAVSSHSAHQDRKRAILEEFGGTLKVVHEHNPSVSTTQILAKST